MPPRLDLVWRTARPLLFGACRLCRPVPSRTTTSSASSASNASSASSPSASPQVVSWTTLAREEELRRQQQRDDIATSSSTSSGAPPPSPGTVLIESLERDPLVPLPSSLPPSSFSSSVLVEPAVLYRHPNETYRSGLRHRLSVLRQSRLEIIRQAQKWPLPDWRDILRRLVAYTPRGSDQVGRGNLTTLQMPSPSLPPLDSLFASLSSSSSSSSSSPSSPDWTSSDSAASPSLWYTDAVSFTFPGDSLSFRELLHGVDDSLWAIRSRTGCVLKMFRRRPTAKNMRATQETPLLDALDADRPWMLTLSGTELSIRQATAEVMRLTKDAVPVVGEPVPETLSADADSEESVSAVNSWSLELTSHFRHNTKIRDDPVFRPYILRHSAHDIPRPAVWTRDSFERYVAALVNGRLAPHLATDLYGESEKDGEKDRQGDEADLENAYAGPPSHDRAVIDILHRIFHEEAARPALSTSAFKMALEFMCRRGEAHRPDARALFVRMEMANMPMDTATFNILLESQVKSQDLRNFGTTLLLMHGRGHAPNLETWELFLRIFASADVKRHILRAMYARGLLDNAAAVRRVAGEMAHHDTEQALRVAERGVRNRTGKQFSLDRFLVHMAARYGDGWLGLNSANRVLGVLATHGRFHDCARLIQHMPRSQTEAQQHLLQIQQAASHFRYQPPLPTVATQAPDVVTFNVVLTHCKEQRTLTNALPFVHLMDTIGVHPDAITYQLLFRMAWLRRLPHVLGVLWHYACAAGLDNYWVRRRVSEFVKTANGHRDRLPLKHVLLAGVSLPETAFASAPESTSESTSESTPSSTRRRPPHSGVIISRELSKRYAGLEPIVPLGEALQDALDRDNAALETRYTAAASPQPLRIPLRKKKNAANTVDVADTQSEQPEYMEIIVPVLPRREMSQSRRKDT